MHNDTNNQDEGSAYQKRSLFGRRQGRALRGERSRVLDEILPLYKINEHELPENYSIPAED